MVDIDFGSTNYTNYPYVNINASANSEGERTIKLQELFEYQDLKIPAPDPPTGAGAGADEYSILNIKKQFICVKFQKPAAGAAAEPEQSRIYVKRPTIDSDLLIILKKDRVNKIPNTSTIKFNVISGSGALELQPNTDQSKQLFEKVYMQIEANHRPYFADDKNSFQGGNKRGGTRKLGGSRSR